MLWLKPWPFRQCCFPAGLAVEATCWPTRWRCCEGLQPSILQTPAEVRAVPPRARAPQVPEPGHHRPGLASCRPHHFTNSAAMGPHSARKAAGPCTAPAELPVPALTEPPVPALRPQRGHCGLAGTLMARQMAEGTRDWTGLLCPHAGSPTTVTSEQRAGPTSSCRHGTGKHLPDSSHRCPPGPPPAEEVASELTRTLQPHQALAPPVRPLLLLNLLPALEARGPVPPALLSGQCWVAMRRALLDLEVC